MGSPKLFPLPIKQPTSSSKSNKFEGPKLGKGKIHNVGGDWGLIKSDGNLHLDVRAAGETNDGAVMHLAYPGICVMTDSQKKELLSGGHPDRMIAQVTPKIHTSHEKYKWVNDLTIIGKGAVESKEDGLHLYYSWYSLKV